MERITIQIKDKEKAKIVLDLLAALDFVESIETSEITLAEQDSVPSEEDDFFALAGLWTDRAISLDSIRQKAWPRRQ